jgi:hypothetical protein
VSGKKELRFLPHVDQVLVTYAKNSSDRKRFLHVGALLGDFEKTAPCDPDALRRAFTHRDIVQDGRAMTLFILPDAQVYARDMDVFCILLRSDDGEMLVMDHARCTSLKSYEETSAAMSLDVQRRTDLNALLDA